MFHTGDGFASVPVEPGRWFTAEHFGTDTSSCGCWHDEASRKHGKSRTPEYQAWVNMIQRCTNPNWPQYAHYGGRGISVCARWQGSFELFLLDMGTRPQQRVSIDREDNMGNYEPSNCRWASRSQQQRNIRNNRTLTVGDETRLLIEWAERTGIALGTLASRLRYGWESSRIVSEPVHRKRQDV